MNFVATINVQVCFVAIWLLFVLVLLYVRFVVKLFVLSPVYTVYDVHDDCVIIDCVLLRTCIYIILCKICKLISI